MKYTLLLALLSLSPFFSQAQNILLEENYIRQQYHSKQWSPDEYSVRREKWMALKPDYPTLPFDTLQKIFKPVEIIEFPGISKEQAFKRIKEWAAIRFSNLDKIQVYEDIENGKLILLGSNEIKHQKLSYTFFDSKFVHVKSNLTFTLVVSVKDNKAKLQFENLALKYYRGGYANGTGSDGYYVPGEWITQDVTDYFPISAASLKEWDINLELVKNCFQSLKSNAEDLNKYIQDAEDSEKF